MRQTSPSWGGSERWSGMARSFKPCQGRGQFHGPAAVAVGMVVDGTVDVDGAFKAGEIPAPIAYAVATRMVFKANTGEGPHLVGGAIKVRQFIVAGFFVSLFQIKNTS